MSSVLAKNPSPDINGLNFETVFEGYFDYVSHTLRCLGVQGSDLEDVVHDVFVQVYRHFAQYDVTRPINTTVRDMGHVHLVKRLSGLTERT